MRAFSLGRSAALEACAGGRLCGGLRRRFLKQDRAWPQKWDFLPQTDPRSTFPAIFLQRKDDLTCHKPVKTSKDIWCPVISAWQDTDSYSFKQGAGALQPEQIYYSFCSLVTDPAQYRAMVQSFVAAGFVNICKPTILRAVLRMVTQA
jgi:hypothetical protein